MQTEIICRALSLVLDDPRCAAYTDGRAFELLGRMSLGDDDERWWEMKTVAVSELLAGAIALNAMKED